MAVQMTSWEGGIEYARKWDLAAHTFATISGRPIDKISCMIFSTPNSHSHHIGSFSDPVNTHWESLWNFREPNLNLFIVPEGFNPLAPPIDKFSCLTLSCSELLRSSCKLVYGRSRCLRLSMNSFKLNRCQDFMLWWLEWQICRFSSFWPLLTPFSTPHHDKQIMEKS